eukprot:2320032-Pyramimonas_sp.AAC.1
MRARTRGPAPPGRSIDLKTDSGAAGGHDDSPRATWRPRGWYALTGRRRTRIACCRCSPTAKSIVTLCEMYKVAALVLGYRHYSAPCCH